MQEWKTKSMAYENDLSGKLITGIKIWWSHFRETRVAILTRMLEKKFWSLTYKVHLSQFWD